MDAITYSHLQEGDLILWNGSYWRVKPGPIIRSRAGRYLVLVNCFSGETATAHRSSCIKVER